MPVSLSRREFLSRASGAAAGAVLTGCLPQPAAAQPVQSATRAETSEVTDGGGASLSRAWRLEVGSGASEEELMRKRGWARRARPKDATGISIGGQI